MCGIAGIAAADPGRPATAQAAGQVARMLVRLAHRGPDGESVRALPGVVLGHRRLAIIDLSERAAQPMPLRCAQDDGPSGPAVWLAFNGEIYNHVELRAQLESGGHRFASDSDTEVMLHLYEEREEAFLHELRGMFALALWDARRRRLLLARDRLGKKPLYYRIGADDLAFASEIKALAGLARERGEPLDPDPVSLRRYLALKYVPGPATALRDVACLPPGGVLTWEAGRMATRRWWELPQAGAPEDRPAGEIHEELEWTVKEAVRLRLRSDVPLGLFLSGGLDSAVVAACMAGAPSGPVRTFTVGFGEADYDEVAQAARTAAHFGAAHQEIRLRPTARQTADLLPRLAWQLDQPFADSSALAVYHLAQQARRHVTVALSGDGADELFLGYDRYRAHRLADRVGRMAKAAGAGSPALGRILSAFLPAPPGRRNLAGRARRFLDSAALPPLARNDAWITCLDPDLARGILADPDPGGADPLEPVHRAYATASRSDPLAAIQRADLAVWLPDDVLRKLDSATMAHSLEARCPLLDHKVVELAMRIPAGMKLKGRQGKAILREAFAGQLPPHAARSRKAGFGLPLDHWLRGELGDHARDLLLDSAALQRGMTRREGVRRLLQDHAAGRANHDEAIWALVMLEHWFRAVLEPAPAIAVAGSGAS